MEGLKQSSGSSFLLSVVSDEVKEVGMILEGEGERGGKAKWFRKKQKS